ncbi:MAG TPA: hypothetical protein VLN46_00685 [Gillisia sp.]|nr:hypothetical protein [Gillisia sp.]
MRTSIIYLLLLFPLFNFSQVGVGTSSPQAQLDIISHSPDNPDIIDGILIPRINRFPSAAPSQEQHGMLVYLNKDITGFRSGFYFWNNTLKKWEALGGSSVGTFYKPGTTTAVQNIDEPAYRMGNIGIGTEEILSKVQIAITGADPNIRRGLEVDNNHPATDNHATYAIISNNRSASNGVKYGFKNNVSGLGTGVRYGIFNEAYQNTGTNDIYGIFNRVGRTFGSKSHNYGIYSQIGTDQGSGNIYGIYSSALGDHNANVFAGYFAGRLGIGATPMDEYIFPAFKGKVDQVLVLDNAGNMNWKFPNIQNYSSTTSSATDYVITDEITSLRINDQITGLVIPPANAHKGRIITLIAWKGTKTKPLRFSGTDDLYDVVNDVSITSITGSQILTMQSAGNRWILLYIRKAP